MELKVFTIPMGTKGLTDLVPITVGWAICNPNHSYGPEVRGCYIIHYVLNGKGFFKTPNEEYEISAGQAFLIKPTDLVFYSASSDEPWEYIWISFEGDFAKNFDSFDDVFNIDGSIFNDMLRAKEYGNYMEEYVSSLLFSLYCEVNKRNDTGTHTDYVNRVIRYINFNYMHDTKISDIADMFNLNRMYLSRIFKEKMDMSIQEYLIYRRLHEAKKLLNKGYNVNETSQMVGYTDYFSFSKAFKKRYGTPPSKYKNKTNAEEL